MKKLLLPFIIGVVIIVGIVLFYLTRGTSEDKTNSALPVTTIAPLSAPRKIDFPNESLVVFSYTGPPLSLPTSLPTYKATYSNDPVSSATILTRQWRFTAPLTKPVPYVYDWIEKEKHFSYNDQAKSVSFAFFTQQKTPASISLTADDVFKALSSVKFLSEDFAFIESGSQTVAPEAGEGGQGLTSSIKITSYQSKVANLPFSFFFNGVSRSTGEMRTDPDGKVISFSFRLSPTLQKEQERQTLTMEGVLTNLNDKRGYLQAIITDESTYAPETVASYSEVKISSITPAYLFIPEESRFVPIYVVEGLGYGREIQRVRYYLRATS